MYIHRDQYYPKCLIVKYDFGYTGSVYMYMCIDYIMRLINHKVRGLLNQDTIMQCHKLHTYTLSAQPAPPKGDDPSN